MDENVEACHYNAFSILVTSITSILGIFVGQKLTEKASRWFGRGSSASKSSQKDIMEIKGATLQIARDWIEMTKLLTNIHDDQKNFVNHLQTQMEDRSETFCKNVTISLEEEFLRNDQRFLKIKRTIEVMQEDILLMKEFLQKLVRMATADACEDKKSKKVTNDSWVQTEYEVKKKCRDSHAKSGTNNENEASKLVTVVKKCLTDLLKDAKLQLSIDREEENRELQIIFSRLTEDREEIKKTIIQAFSIAAEQAKNNLEHIGQDAMHYIAVLNENTNKMLKIKLEETNDRLKEIAGTLNKQIFDVVTIREILENIDGQFDNIFQRVEIGCQKNTEHCEEMAQNLERASNNWMGTISNLGEIAKDFTSDTKMMKSVLNEMKNAIDSVNQKDPKDNQIVYSDNNEIMQHDAITSTTTQNLELSQKHRNLIFTCSMIQACWEKLTCMNNRVENGCEEICQLVQALTHKLQSLNQTVEKLDGVIRDINIENCAGRIICAKCHDVSSKEIENVMKNSMLDAGDCQPQMCNSIRTILTNETLTQKVQNAIAIDKEVKMIELILQKVCEEKRNNSFKNKAAAEEEQGIFSREELQARNAEGETAEWPVIQMVMQDNAEINLQDNTKMHR